MRKHNPKHQFQIVEHLDMTIDTLQDFLVIVREPQTKCTTLSFAEASHCLQTLCSPIHLVGGKRTYTGVKIRRPYPGVSVYEVRFGRKHLFYSTTLAAQASQIARAFPEGMPVLCCLTPDGYDH
jgi:hypothetical protein